MMSNCSITVGDFVQVILSRCRNILRKRCSVAFATKFTVNFKVLKTTTSYFFYK